VALSIGALLAVLIALFARGVGLDRDRAFYPTVLIVIGLLYVLFAVIGGSREALLLDGLLCLVFVAAAVVGFRYSLWVVVLGLIGHGMMDLVHHRFVANPGVPVWWPGFCLSYDVVAGLVLGLLIVTKKIRAVG
jgi:hypothetical protein